MTVAHIKPAEIETFSLDWGTMKWFVSPVTIPGAANSQGEVIVNPGQGHARHLHERSDELIYVVLMRDGDPMRYFPLGAKADSHVPLRVVEDLLSDTRLEVHMAAPEASSGFAVIDIGLVEV